MVWFAYLTIRFERLVKYQHVVCQVREVPEIFEMKWFRCLLIKGRLGIGLKQKKSVLRPANTTLDTSLRRLVVQLVLPAASRLVSIANLRFAGLCQTL